jgi:membrane-associated phospholipid phosphatase
MRYRRFLPYSVVGTGIWGPGLCVLGYVFYQSFDKVTKVAGRATLVFTALVAIGVGVWYLHKRLRDPEDRAKATAWLERQGERPLLRPVAAVVRPVARFAGPRLRFLAQRVTPGELGLEFTTVLAVAGVGFYTFIAYTVTLAGDPTMLTPADSSLLKLADRTKSSGVIDVVKVYTSLGSLPVVGAFVLVSVVALAMRSRPVELGALLIGFLVLVAAVHATKAGVDRPRPPGELVHTVGSSFPSGHSAYATAYIAMAVIAWRVVPGFGRKALLILAAVVVAASIGMSRIYLRAHYWSDVAGGWGLGCGIFALCAVVVLLVLHLRETAPARA